MIFGKDRMMKKNVCAVLVSTFLFAVPVLSADNLYEGFKNPPVSAKPIMRWCWDVNGPGEQEILNGLDSLKKAGFGGVEIKIGEDTNTQMFRFAADAAKQRGMIADLSISTLGGSFVLPAEQGQQITISKKQFTGPVNTVVNINDLIKVSDPNHRFVFLRLIQTDAFRFLPGEDLTAKLKSDGTIAVDINDANIFTLYAGVIRPVVTSAGSPALDLLNKQASEKYFNNILAKLTPASAGKLGDTIRSVESPSFEPAAINWTSDFPQEFLKRYGYDITPYLPAVLDNDLPRERTRFYDTIRRARYDFYSVLAWLYHERFVSTFRNFCRDNGVMSRIPAGLVDILDSCSVPLDIYQGDIRETVPAMQYQSWDKIASSAAHLADKSLVIGWLTLGKSENSESLRINDGIDFVSGINQTILGGISFPVERNPAWPYVKNWTGRNARLSYLFQNSRHQARIAVLYPAADIWSDCCPSGQQLADCVWYLFPLVYALNQNGYTVDFVSEKIFPQATFEGGKFHFGSKAYDAVLVPDVFSMEFLTVKALRFYAEGGGKIAFIGRQPLTGTGFRDIIQRGVPVDMTMSRHLEKSDPNRVLFVPAPEKGRDNLLSWTSDVMKKISVLPTVGFSSPSDKVLFAHYIAGDSDILFFVNTDKSASASFRAKFDAAGKKPWLWNPDTGKREKFARSGKSGELNVSIKHGETLLLVFEPETKAKKAK